MDIFKYIKSSLSKSLTNPTFLTDIYIHTLILFTFLSSLFFFYIVDLSMNAFKNHIDEIIHGMSDKLFKLKETSFIKNNILNLNLKKLIDKKHEEDEFVKQNNKNIKSSIILVNVLLWVFIISIVILYNKLIHGHKECSKYDKIDWVEEIIQNTIVFSVIGIIEFIFLTNIIIKFIPVEPSFIVSYGLEQLKKKFYVSDDKQTK